MFLYVIVIEDGKILLKDCPRLRNYFLEILTQCYADAVDNLIDEYDVNFLNVCPSSEDIDILLNHHSWENI